MILAIDFGTSNSLAALATEKGCEKPLPLEPEAADPSVLRSLLFFPSQNQCFYGHRAVVEHQNNLGQGRFIRSIKKFLPSQNYLGSWIEERVVKLEDLIGLFLLEVKNEIEKLLKKAP